ncbi:MAG TPA: biotin carboxylase N-terminal domain-containing protein [Paracoccus sp. (in: a-proteobacteria)]|uniref:acetyl/propionyl/methylcrotonyl-CoA carboxylase subunit alpha n=1 Tax=Paracoccus sp. TaxID=267 RepID=UPI002CCDCC99|nr:biotin carboxylase N-terminal domain-containing protein [Paracoccus sp. (in: a-proteobacteria)]HWL57315.1 biotin carboxylase N-terminal domain-containing protein [Paracoccus sp. (in: a-proteobacteria)]
MTLFATGPDRPITRLLIANRGEIAVRIIRACRDEGIAAIAIYADSDRDALFVRMADEAHALGGEKPAESYLNAEKIIAIAREAGADAIHPGYGFLSERADFAAAVQEAGLIWIGPDPSVIEALGDKIEARRIAEAVGAPLVAGTPGPVETPAEALAFAKEHGLPIAIKAAFGGGGRGMKVAWRLEEVEELFESATREALTAFGRGECFIEQFLDRPRHIEAQVLADRHGTVKVIGTRDCSLQRRNQKLVEEAPAPFLTDEQRARIHEAARAICAHAGYSGAGTVEFLLSGNGTISFLEVNTRLQVEHPVTEETTGIDLVRGMIRVAQGARLADETVPEPRGHSIEFRINAEDPARGFLPTPGPVEVFDAPSGPGIRLDSGVVSGSVVPGSFDSMMAKLIVTGATREEALARAARALREFRIEGVASVLPFDQAVLDEPDFRAENGDFRVHTRWIETDFAEALAAAMEPHARVTPAAPARMLRLAVEIDGKRHELGLPANLLAALPAGGAALPEDAAPEADEAVIGAPVAGTLTLWQAEDGAEVEAGQVIAVIEAMKMETRIEAHRAGRLEQLAEAGKVLGFGAPVARIA